MQTGWTCTLYNTKSESKVERKLDKNQIPLVKEPSCGLSVWAARILSFTVRKNPFWYVDIVRCTDDISWSCFMFDPFWIKIPGIFNSQINDSFYGSLFHHWINGCNEKWFRCVILSSSPLGLFYIKYFSFFFSVFFFFQSANCAGCCWILLFLHRFGPAH